MEESMPLKLSNCIWLAMAPLKVDGACVFLSRTTQILACYAMEGVMEYVWGKTLTSICCTQGFLKP
jgi:hypothetical protein